MRCFLVLRELDEEFLEGVFGVDRGGKILGAAFGFGQLHVADLVEGIGSEAAVGVAVEHDLVSADRFLVFLLIFEGLPEFELHGGGEFGEWGGGQNRGVHFCGLLVPAVVHLCIGDRDLRFNRAVEFTRLREVFQQLLVRVESTFGIAQRVIKFAQAQLRRRCGGGDRVVADQCAVSGDGLLGVAGLFPLLRLLEVTRGLVVVGAGRGGFLGAEATGSGTGGKEGGG